MNRKSRLPALAAILGAIFLASTFALATSGKKASTSLGDRSLAFSGDPNKPRHHFRVKDVADLTDKERETLYREIRDRLQAGYSVSGSKTAKGYQRWTRVNTAPYHSATHGRRFINNYINSVASPYLEHEKAGTLPIGAIIAKDSFVVAKDGALTPGPLFVMEKMEKGFSYVSGDWRYSMVMPDGSFFGETNGENAERVEFCIGCHLAREKHDHLYFVPAKYRKR